MGFVTAIRDFLFGPPPPSDEERRLLKAIALDPENDALYVEYGNRLKQAGNEWGEFVLVDHQLEKMAEDDPARGPLDDRWGQLHAKHLDRLFARLKRMGVRPMMGDYYIPLMWVKHGVIREVNIDHAGVLPERADELLLGAPGLQRLQLHGVRFKPGFRREFENWEPDFPAILALPQLEQVSDLDFSSMRFDGAAVRALAAGTMLHNLRVLAIDNLRAEPDELQALFGSPRLGNLRELDVSFTDSDVDSLCTLIANPQVTRLRRLEVRGEELTPNVVRAIAGAPSLRQLETLRLPKAPLDGEGARLLAESPYLRKLTTLKLPECKIDGAGMAALARSANLANVVELDLSENAVGDAGAEAIAASPHLGKLAVTLNLTKNGIGERGAAALARSANLTRLKKLELDGNPIGDAGAAALAATPFAQLKELWLGDCNISGRGLAELLRARWVTGLTHLNIGPNPLGDEGARALLAANNLSNMEMLFASGDGMSEDLQSQLKEKFGNTLHL